MATETLRPDGELSDVGLVANSETDHDDDPDVSSVTIDATGNNVSTEWGADFPTPTGDPTVGADLQEFRAGVEEFDSGQTGTPTARIELWENGSLVRAGSNTNVSTYAVLSFTWNTNELATADGSLVQCKVIGTKSGGSPSTRNTVRIGHVEWNVDYTAGGTTFFETLAPVVSATAALTTVPIFVAALAVIVAAPAAFAKMISKTLSPVVAGIAEAKKGNFKTLAVSTSATPTLAEALFVPKTIASITANTASLVTLFIAAAAYVAGVMRKITRAVMQPLMRSVIKEEPE